VGNRNVAQVNYEWVTVMLHRWTMIG